MAFRNWDNWDVYIDNDRKILRGCIQFMLKDGTTVANIYDADKTPISNPQITDINGRTEEQVFVSEDVRAYVYKYVGTGTIANERELGINTSDQTKWALQYTIESASIDEKEVSGLSAMCVGTMLGFRALDPTQVPEIDGNKVVCLQGYYECGDCEPVWYVWDDQSMLNDDNGSVIQADDVLTGRWILVQPTEHCDSRHFGVFPQDSVDSTEDHSTRMTQLISYCNTRSIHPYFNGSQSYPYFIYQNIAFQSRNPIDVSDDTVFVDKGTGNRFFGEWNGNPYFYNAHTLVNSTEVRHSWHFQDYTTGTVRYIVDSTWSPVLLSNIEVVLEISPASSSQLDDCELTSNEKITNSIVMENMTIHTDWFADDYNWSNLSMYNCKVLLDNCKDANTYVLLKNKLNQADYGDLGEQTLSNTTLLANAIAENASFNNVTIVGNTELHNISGDITVSGAAYTLNVIDCWLTIDNMSQVVLSDILWRRGAVACSAGIQPLNTLYLDDVDVNATFICHGMNPQMYNCAIRSEQRFYRQATIVGCKVFANIMHYPETYTLDEQFGPGQFWYGEFLNNTFLNGSKIYLAPVDGVDYSDLDLGLMTKICNNYSDHNFVDDSLWNGVAKHGWQTYAEFRYQGNIGGCPVYEEAVTYDLPYTAIWPHDETGVHTDYGQYCMIPPGTDSSTGAWVVVDHRTAPDHDYAYDLYWILNFKDVQLNTSRLFKLPYLRGSTFLDVEVDATTFIRPDQYTDWPISVNTFHITGALVSARVQVGTDIAYLNSVRPYKFAYTGDRYCDNDQIDESMSSLYQTLYAYSEHQGYFGLSGSITVKFKSAGLVMGSDGRSHLFGRTSQVE